MNEEQDGWILAAPGLLLVMLCLALPFVLAIGLSLTDMRLGSPFATRWVGWHNYARLTHDPTFLRALANNALFAAVVVPLQTGLALGLACLLNQPLVGIGFYRTLFFLPVAFPMALVAVVWEPFLGSALHDPQLALPCLMAISLWQGLGLQVVILLAGLQSIPEGHYEVARLEGASPGQSFWNVTLPGLRNPLTFTALLTTVLAFRVFDQVQILTRGGPADATTTVLFALVRTSFDRLQVGQASAMAVVFFLIVLGLTVLQRALVREEAA